jgi:hypothetical protein
MKPVHVFTCGAAEFQVMAKDKRQATVQLAEYLREEAIAGTVKDWRYQGCYSPERES